MAEADFLRIRSELDFIAVKLGQDPNGAMHHLSRVLTHARETDPANWKKLRDEVVLPHEVTRLVWADPITKRSFDKPRGYPGDAELLDMIYQDDVSEAHPVTQHVYDVPECRAVRWRRDHIARVIDELPDESGLQILSLAAGHLREAHRSERIREGRFQTFLAVDQDPRSLAEVERSAGSLGVTAEQGSVKSALVGALGTDRFDLAYAAGLYDYLEDRLAGALLRALLKATKPGGSVLIANFTPHPPSIGYMESFMGWELLYRDEKDMGGLVPPGLPFETYRDKPGAVVYLRVTKV